MDKKNKNLYITIVEIYYVFILFVIFSNTLNDISAFTVSK